LFDEEEPSILKSWWSEGILGTASVLTKWEKARKRIFHTKNIIRKDKKDTLGITKDVSYLSAE